MKYTIVHGNHLVVEYDDGDSQPFDVPHDLITHVTWRTSAIPRRFFVYYRNLIDVSIECDEMTTVEIGSEAFNSCASLQRVSVKNCTNLWVGAYAFSSCTALSEFPFEYVVFAGKGAFMHCHSIQSVLTNTTYAKSGNVFSDCSNLTTVFSFGTSDVSVYEDCPNLERLTVHLRYAKINQDYSLNVDVPPLQIKTDKLSVPYVVAADLFSPALRILTKDSPDINYTYDRDINRDPVVISNDINEEYIRIRYAGMLCTVLSIPFPLSGFLMTELVLTEAVSSVPRAAFMACLNLAVVTWACPLDVPAAAFLNCPRLHTFVYSADRMLTIGDAAFRGCHALAQFPFERVASIGACAFARCENLRRKIVVNECTGTGAFSDCSRITEVVWGAASIPARTFDSCGSLERVTLLRHNTDIGVAAFKRCTDLETFPFERVASIGEDAFNFCRGLGEVVAPHCTRVQPTAFTSCTSLRRVGLGRLRSLDLGAFSFCSELDTVALLAPPGEILGVVKDAPLLDSVRACVSPGVSRVYPLADLSAYYSEPVRTFMALLVRRRDDYTAHIAVRTPIPLEIWRLVNSYL